MQVSTSFFFSSRRRHTRSKHDWSSDVCSSHLVYAGTSSEGLGRIVGAFLVLSVPLRRILAWNVFQMRLRHFPVLGAVVGRLSALVVTTGPINTPFFLAYGLRRSAYIGTESVCAMAMHLARGAALARYRLMTWE